MDHHHMHLDPLLDDPDSPLPTQQPTPEPPGSFINITPDMWENVFNRMARQDATIARQNDAIEALTQRNVTLERELNALAHSGSRLNKSEPKLPDAPVFKGDRTELLPFLSKCQWKFEGQPSQFENDRAKVLYAGTRLEGIPFTWFQPLIKSWPAGGPSEQAPSEICSWEAFKTSLTSIYGDPNLAATADREIRALKQTGSVAEYAAKFESKKQYLSWNDSAYRDQFYFNLDRDIKDTIAPFGKPETFKGLKELAIRLDARKEERRLEIRQEHGRASQSSTAARQAPRFNASTTYAKATSTPTSTSTPTPAATSTTPQTALRVPSHSSDGTVPMELDANGVWRLAASEKERRKRQGLCDYCAAKEHSVDRCPVRPPSMRPRLDRRAFMSIDIVTENPGKDATQE
jgi:hypothetical protein